METDLKFNLSLKEIPVSLTGEDGLEQRFTLREMTGKVRDAYLNGVGARTRLDSSGKPVMLKDFSGMMGHLICVCLFSPDGKNVPLEDVQKFPASVQSKLFEVCREINALDELGEEEVKNE